jgi:6-phosphogluconolactonase (cycloisomerase 2 family)
LQWRAGAAAALAAALALAWPGTILAQQCDLHQINFNVITDGSGIQSLNGASGVAVSPDGDHLIVAANADDTITVFSRAGAEGDLSVHQTFWRTSGSSAPPSIVFGVTGLDGANAVAVSPDGTSAYAVGTNADALVSFSRDATPTNSTYGLLTLEGTITNGFPSGLANMDAPVDVAVSEDGAWVVVASSSGDALALLARDTSGDLTPHHEIQHGQGSPVLARLRSPRAVAFKDNHAYSTSAGSSGTNNEAAITVFEIDTSGSQGQLIPIQTVVDHTLLRNASDVAVSNDGTSLYVAATTADAVVVYDRDLETGTLTYHQTITHGSLNDTSGVAVNATDSRVYATGRASDSLLALQRNPTTGGLGAIEVIVNGDAIPGNPGATVAGLNGAVNLVVSPDTDQIYVVADIEDSVAWFESWEASSKTCSDGSACTENDHCDGTSGACVGDNLELGAPCQDPNPCTIDDACDGEGQCVASACNVDFGCGCDNICQIVDEQCTCGPP